MSAPAGCVLLLPHPSPGAVGLEGVGRRVTHPHILPVIPGDTSLFPGAASPVTGNGGAGGDSGA